MRKKSDALSFIGLIFHPSIGFANRPFAVSSLIEIYVVFIALTLLGYLPNESLEAPLPRVLGERGWGEGVY
jgi:hypothetical protein